MGFCSLFSQALGSCLKLQNIETHACGSGQHESTTIFEDVFRALLKCVDFKKIHISGREQIFGPPLVSFLLSADGRLLDLSISFDDLKFVCTETAVRREKLASVGKIEGPVVNSCFLPQRNSGAYGKEEFDLIFLVLPELKFSSFAFAFSKERDASGLVTSFLDNYRGAENVRRLYVTLCGNDATVPPDIMGELGNLLLDVRKSLGVVREVLLNLADLKNLQQDIEKKHFVLRRRLSIKFEMGNSECLLELE